jgi:TetR/AcrR family transcriptional regulator, mexJK operon transcriptional repressor
MTENTVKNPRHRPVDQAKRAAILDAARHEFFVHGFAGASIEAIAEASKVSKVTIYNRFATKEALFAAMVEQQCFLMSAGFDALALKDGDLRQQLVGFGERALEFLTQPHVMRFESRLASESEHMPHVGELFLNAGPRRMRQYLIDVIEQAVTNHSLKPCDSSLAAGHLYGMIVGFDIFMTRFSREQLSHEERQSHVAIAVDKFLELYSVA